MPKGKSDKAQQTVLNRKYHRRVIPTARPEMDLSHASLRVYGLSFNFLECSQAHLHLIPESHPSV